MTKENREIRSVKDLLLENEALEARNDFLQRCVESLKLHNSQLTIERNELCCSINRISRELAKYKTNATPSDIAEEEFIANGETHYYAAAYGDD